MEFIDKLKKGDPNSGSVTDPDKIISLLEQRLDQADTHVKKTGRDMNNAFSQR